MSFLSKISWFKKDEGSYSLSTSKEERDEFCSSIISSSSPSWGFYLLLFLATFIVAIGLVKNNIVLLIGGMLVAPLLSPILSLSLSMTIFNFKVFLRSLFVFIFSALSSLVVSFLIALFLDFDLDNLEFIKSMNRFDLSAFLIPVAAGAAASFAWVKKELSSSLPGVAVTVTLMPPLAAMGLALPSQNYEVFKHVLIVYALNVSGIILGSLAIFLILGFYKSTKKVISEVEKEIKA